MRSERGRCPTLPYVEGGMPVPPRGEAGLSCEVCRGRSARPLYGGSRCRRPRGAPAWQARRSCVSLVTRRHRPHNPRSNPGPTCPQTSVIAPPAQVCSRRRVCVWPLISSIYGGIRLRITRRLLPRRRCSRRTCVYWHGWVGIVPCVNRGRSWINRDSSFFH